MQKQASGSGGLSKTQTRPTTVLRDSKRKKDIEKGNPMIDGQKGIGIIMLILASAGFFVFAVFDIDITKAIFEEIIKPQAQEAAINAQTHQRIQTTEPMQQMQE